MLTEYGEIAEKYIKQLGDFYEHLSIEGYVIMPDHIHIMLSVNEDEKRTPVNGQSRTATVTERANSTVSKFVSTFKRFCNKEYGENIWQARSNDHIIRNRQDFEEHMKYIYENPARWYFREE